MALTVISYYTQDWLYPQYAQSLRDSCQALGLACYIVERPSTQSYVGNCQIKPFFIQECLRTLDTPVMWIDADASLLRSPRRLLEPDVAQYDLVANPVLRSPGRIHVGSFLFNQTPAAHRFVDAWCAEIIRKRPLDDAAFNGTWDSMQTEIKFLGLPPEYFYIQHRTSDPVPPDTVILHRLSRSELKEQYKQSTQRR